MGDTPAKPDKADEVGIPIPFRFHPRVFAALGADLVTNDLVAVIELVKNSYDAFARRVDVRFKVGDDGKLCLEIEDDGLGMSEETIREVWCVVATPFRAENTTSKRQEKQRRVTGAKGLGRLSAARLGNALQVRDMTSERLALVKTSGISQTSGRRCRRSGGRAAAGPRCRPGGIARCAAPRKNNCPEKSATAPPPGR